MTEPDLSPLDALVAAVVDLGGPLTSIVDHMQRCQASGGRAPDALPIDVVLRGLLGDVLDPMRDEFPAADVEAAVRVLTRVIDRVESEIYLVPLPQSRPRRPRRRP